MNILFLTISRIDDISVRNIYTDLMRKFRNEGHKVYIISPIERCYGQSTVLSVQENVSILKIKTLNLQKTTLIEKGISTLLIEYQFLAGAKRYFSKIKFDLVLYSTPPITFIKVVKAIKKRDVATSYLLLKDIFPQNAVDLGMLKKDTFIHRYFKKKESRLYAISDHIGCMSPANVEYVLRNNPTVNPQIVEVNPNSLEPIHTSLSKDVKTEIRLKYGIPVEKSVFVYGGNLGKPQGIDFLIEVLDANRFNENSFFVVVGSGTEFSRIRKWFLLKKPANSILLTNLPQSEYDELVQACDVGLLFLDARFTIPNYPSRLLSYLEFKIPIIAATDVNTDVGKMAENNGYGFWCKSGDLKSFNEIMERMTQNPELIGEMGEAGYHYFVENFTVDKSFSIIMKHLNFE